MKPTPRSKIIGALAVTVGLLAVPRPSWSQIVSLRTAPIATGEQYVVLPSENFGMGGVGLALRDALADPFSNPALGSRLNATRAFASPTFYHIGGADGGGRTLTTGILGTSGRVFGGLTVSLQELEKLDDPPFFWTAQPTGQQSQDVSFLGDDAGNRYMNALGGFRLANGRTSIGAGVSHASLNVVDGMRQLYANSMRVSQDGGITDYKLGVVHELERGWFEANVIHSRIDIDQDVAYQEMTWDPMQPPGPPTVRTWVQRNQDVSRTNGLRASYVRELDAPGWRLGLSATANRKTHPHLPDYDLARLPRDPGTTTAFDLGVGIAREHGGTRFGVDVNFTPASSHTWADSDTAIMVPQSGQVIQPGAHTVDNEFDFANLRMATGFSRDGSKGGWQVGLSVINTSYRLDQENHVLVRRTKTQESWTEWVPTWGLHRTFGDISLRYSGRLVMKGFPDLGGQAFDLAAPSRDGQDLLVPITGPVFLPDYSIFTNQFSVSIAIGDNRR